MWAVLGTGARQLVAIAAGDRSAGTARRLWAAVPVWYRDRAVVCTGFWGTYLAEVPTERHARVGKEEGLINHIERFWNTPRQRCSRAVHRTQSFSKCVRNHVGALWRFVRHYNASRQ